MITKTLGKKFSANPPVQFPFKTLSSLLGLLWAVHPHQLVLSRLVEVSEYLVEIVDVDFQVLIDLQLLVGYQRLLRPHHLITVILKNSTQGNLSCQGGILFIANTYTNTNTWPGEILLVANIPMPRPMPAGLIMTGGQNSLCFGQKQFLSLVWTNI